GARYPLRSAPAWSAGGTAARRPLLGQVGLALGPGGAAGLVSRRRTGLFDRDRRRSLAPVLGSSPKLVGRHLVRSQAVDRNAAALCRRYHPGRALDLFPLAHRQELRGRGACRGQVTTAGGKSTVCALGFRKSTRWVG